VAQYSIEDFLKLLSNEKADQAAKEALDEDISSTETYPSDDMNKWLTEEDFKKRDEIKMEKRKKRDERTETRRRQKRGYERNAIHIL
jgi:hypothetical protein